MFPVGPW
jgi:hypothetical protein